MKTNRERAFALLDKMINNGISERMLLDYIIGDHLSGQDAYDALIDAEKEFFNNPDDFYSEEEYDVSSFDEED
jgi:hypothetical protein